MKKISFVKMVASGNDFVVIERWSHKSWTLKKLASRICDRKFGVGADGLLVLEKSEIAEIKMRIFNPDGSEAQMCGNGARCVALYIKSKIKKPKIRIETKSGIIHSQVDKDNVKIKLTEPKDIKLNIPIKINNRTLKVNFINTGVPHTVIFVEGLEKINVVDWGRLIRFHKRFSPAGTNVDFVEVLNNHSIKIRTYERGVEDETLACGTGAVAGAIISSFNFLTSGYKKINVQTKSK
ncbi:MAG: diaminopimelate epimerase, partial [Candidatus Omnitrophica bacterium]|nr:diaminopimelate epimerase [Candidatus Omnitrophota bacterium]